MVKICALAAAFIICLASAVLAQTGSISITDVWARASNLSTGVVYMTINNSGGTDDRLVAAQSPVAKTVQVHIEINDNGIEKMRQLRSIDVKSNSKATLAPGGIHLMLAGLKHHLKNGQSFPLTLTFEKAGKIEVKVAVKKAGSMGDSMGGMKM